MKNRSFILIAVILVVAALSWSISGLVGAAVKGGNEEFRQWRDQNVGLFYVIWAVEVVAISIPLVWIVGRRLQAQEAARDQKALAVRGVGRLTAEALRGKEAAIARLVKLLDVPERVVRYQAARALVLVDQPASNKELVRKVSYWPGDQKLALVDVLRDMKDPRARKLLKVLARDRSPLVSGRARAVLGPQDGTADKTSDIVARRKREAEAAEKARAGATTQETAEAPAPGTTHAGAKVEAGAEAKEHSPAAPEA